MKEEELARLAESLKPGVVEAIDAMFEMVRAIGDNHLSINDLKKGLAIAIAGPREGDDGHGSAIISLGMISIALQDDAGPLDPLNQVE